MINIEQDKTEKAILVAIRMKDISDEIISEHLDELEMLADTAGAETILKVTQDKYKYDPAYYLGKGKIEEIAELAEMNEINLVIFDDDLTATQVRNLEKIINKKILDRSGLILDIFAAHAKTDQAKTQVELAQMQYMLPRLTRAWTHLSKQYGGIGTKGPGETQIETDRRIVRTRISRLKEKLKKIELQQITKSASRKNYVNASLIGYTNAGKSTLINKLTNAGVLAEDKLFATLDSTTRAFEIERGKKIIISDTVGFIRKLPHNLIESFKSTLHVVREADLIMHVIDAANPFFEDHIRVVNETLTELGCEKKEQIMIFNKVDKISDRHKLDYIANQYPGSILLSAERGFNIGKLKEVLLNFYEKSFVVEELIISNTRSKLISMIHTLADVISTEYIDNDVKLKYRADSATANKIRGMASEKGNSN